MIITTPRIKPARRLAGARGFTLTEVIVAATLSTFILAGVLSAFLMIGRTAYAASNYSELDAEVRRALDTFGADVRKSTGLQWHSAQSVTLFVVAPDNTALPVTYGFEPAAGGMGEGIFFRMPGEPAAGNPRLTLVRGVAPDFAFSRFKLEQAGVTDNSASNDLETKQLQISLRPVRRGSTLPDQSQAAVSARYILRNKRVTN